MSLAKMCGVGVIAVLIVAAQPADAQTLRVNGERTAHHILQLSRFGHNPDGGVSRVAYSDADIEGRAYIRALMQDAGLTVRVDAAGNIIGHRRGSNAALAPIMFGSHIDSAPNGGNYDGDVGVIAAIEVVQTLNDADRATRHPLEVIVFANEEGGLVGSRALTGRLPAEALTRLSHSGFTIGDGIRRIGGNPEALGPARVRPGDIAAFLELHIEQGAILHEEGIDIGIVLGIVGIRWWDVTVEGMANHAGTTPMNRRRDALLAAARMVIAVNRAARGFAGGQVATVGRIEARPGAANVIPGEVRASLEIRDLSENRMAEVFDVIAREARAIEKKAGVVIRFDEIPLDARPVPTDPHIREIIARVTNRLDLTGKRMASGAGHDAQEMATVAPTGMIFVPSVGGISHSPNEFTEPRDMANGANVLLHTILELDQMRP